LKENNMSVDGADLSKITKSSMEEVIAAAAPVATQKAGWFLSRALAAVLSVVLPLAGGVFGFAVGRMTAAAPAAVEASAGSGSAAPAASGSAAEGTAATAIPYDAKTVAADALVGTPNGTGEVVHPAHPADAAAADAGADQ
jgi:hypothetical protein